MRFFFFFCEDFSVWISNWSQDDSDWNGFEQKRKGWASKMFDRMNDSYFIYLGAGQGVLNFKLIFLSIAGGFLRDIDWFLIGFATPMEWMVHGNSVDFSTEIHLVRLNTNIPDCWPETQISKLRWGKLTTPSTPYWKPLIFLSGPRGLTCLTQLPPPSKCKRQFGLPQSYWFSMQIFVTIDEHQTGTS